MIGFYTPLAYNNYAPFMWQFNIVYQQTQSLIGDSLRNFSENSDTMPNYPNYGYPPFGCYVAPTNSGGAGISEAEEAPAETESETRTATATEDIDDMEEADEAEEYDAPEVETKNTSKTRSTRRTYTTDPISTPGTQQNTEKEAKALRNEFITVAQSYSNCSESNGTHRKFCTNPTCRYEDPEDKEWCTDFVTYVIKETFRKNGKSLPPGFVGYHDVETMKNWAISKGMFIRTSNQPRKADYIAKNIQRGDIIVINENKASHIGFVTKVDDDGVIHTIEGNREDKVKGFAYTPNYNKISGFIRIK